MGGREAPIWRKQEDLPDVDRIVFGVHAEHQTSSKEIQKPITSKTFKHLVAVFSFTTSLLSAGALSSPP